MIKLTLAEVVQAVAGRVRTDAPTLSVTGVSTDSRSTRAGELFFAIPGERFDGHAFVPAALARGAAGAVIAGARLEEVYEALRKAPPPAAPVLVEVADTVAALGDLAAFHRTQFAGQVIAVVGSNGKTTTKAMIDQILAARFRGRCSPKSFNNQIGVPLTLLSAELADDYLVVEIGTNAPGEVAALAAIAQPDLAVITCVGEEHLEGLRDLHGVMSEECSVLGKLTPSGFAAVNIENPQIRAYLPAEGVTLATFGRAAEADLRLTDVRYADPWLHLTINNRFEYRLRMPGAHNALNAAGAIAVARRLGLDHLEIAARLEHFVAPPMRNEMLRLGEITLVNDAYNANPHSALAAIATLESLPAAGRRVLVFGEMRELGPRSPELHRQIAERLRASQVNHVVLIGPAGGHMAGALSDGRLFGPSVACCDSVPACAGELTGYLRDGDVVLVKASRAVGLEALVDALRRHYAPSPAPVS